ncbi:Na+/H+ antiporter subunit E [Pseudomonadota bacterium]
MKHFTLLFIFLFGLWLLLSGEFAPLLISLGVLSCLLVLYLVHRMDFVDHELHPMHLHPGRILAYWSWLIKEIFKSNIDVARIIVSSKPSYSPEIFRVKTSQIDEIGQVIFANSITLTPGTVSMEVNDDEIEVHALTSDAAEALLSGEMDRRVRRLYIERNGVKPKS